MVSIEEFKKRASKKHKNFYSYEYVSFCNISDKVKIICPVHGAFTQLAYNHLRGYGCLKCSNERTHFKQRYRINHNFFDEIGTKQAYVLGFFYSDGHLRKKGNVISFSQSNANGKILLKKIRKIMGSNYPIRLNKKTNSYRFDVSSKSIKNFLINIGITNEKTYSLVFPSFLDKKLFTSFFRGYIDGDGSCGIYDNGKGYRYLCISFVGTKKFINKSKKLIPVSGLRTRKIHKCKNLYEIRANGKTAIKLAKWVWSEQELPGSYKEKIWRNYFQSHQPNFLKYEKLKSDALERLNNGESVIKIAKDFNIAFQTIYKWKKYAKNN